MSTSDAVAAEPVVEPAAEPKPAADGVKPDTGTDDAPKTVPYERFTEVNERMKAAEAKNAQNVTDQKKINDAKLAADGKFKELLDDSTALVADLSVKADKLDAYEASRRETLLSKLPEETRKTYEKLDLEALESHVELVLGANGNTSGMASSAPASGSTDTPTPKSRKDMTQKELIADGGNRRAEFLAKYGGVTVDQLRHPTRIPAK